MGLFETLAKTGKRVLVVGGAASLEIAPGKQLIDTEGFPDFIKVEAEPARQALKRLQANEDIDWTFLSPSVSSAPASAPAPSASARDELLTAEDGKSHISYEDYSIALLDEIEEPKA